MLIPDDRCIFTVIIQNMKRKDMQTLYFTIKMS